MQTQTLPHNNIPAIPMYVEDAIARVHRTNIRYEAILAAYRSVERARYELDPYQAEDDADNKAAAALVAKAQELAQRNGWDWEEVETMVREARGYNSEWRTPTEQGMYDGIAHLI